MPGRRRFFRCSPRQAQSAASQHRTKAMQCALMRKWREEAISEACASQAEAKSVTVSQRDSFGTSFLPRRFQFLLDSSIAYASGLSLGIWSSPPSYVCLRIDKSCVSLSWKSVSEPWHLIMIAIVLLASIGFGHWFSTFPPSSRLGK
jgi:hypothetical protein